MTGYWVVFCLLACGELLVRVNAEVATAVVCDGKECQNGASKCSIDNKCHCLEGWTGDTCVEVLGCTEELLYVCNELSLYCIYDNIEKRATCNCPGKNENFNGTHCTETCVQDSDCSNGMNCMTEEVVRHCQCVPGLSGDRCEIIEECETGKFKHCNSVNGGQCKFVNLKLVCECEDGKAFDTNFGICRETCVLDSDCSNDMECKIVEDVGHCQCASGLSGDKCEIIEDCRFGKFKNCNTDTGGECKFLNGKSVCVCENGKEFDTILEICRETCVGDSYCYNDMNCKFEDDVGHCQCVPGLSGDKCEIIDDCSTGKFKKCRDDTGGECKFWSGKSVCECKDGKEFDIILEVCRDTCEQNRDCGNGMDCWIKDGVGHCQCVDGLSGDKCEIIEECKTGKFKHCNTVNGGQCKFVNLKPVCECEDGKGFDSNLGICRDTCEQASDCSNGMECKIEEDVGHCQCVPGLSGDKCDIIDECVTGIFKNCNKGGQCRFVDMKSVCECENGKEFDTILEICRDPCFSNPCKNYGVCRVINSTDYLCECKQPFSGNHCERHPCHSNPCLNDGTCIAVENNYGCVCDEPFYGRHCENDPCTPSPCKNDGLCEVVGIDFNCTCKASYFGKKCQAKFLTTDSKYTMTDHFSGEITTNIYECYCGENSVSCRLNWLGEKLCFCKEGYDQRRGTDICSRTCQSNADCRNDGICDRDGPGYFCMCREPFIGDQCELDVCNSVRFECRSKGAECVRQGTIGVCKCPTGMKMSLYNYCEDICTYETCVHGTCELTGYNFSQYVCNCYEGYYGRHCENAEVMQYTPAISILVILASGIVLFSITSIVAGCWVRKLRKKIAENTKQTGQP